MSAVLKQRVSLQKIDYMICLHKESLRVENYRRVMLVSGIMM